MQDFRRLRVWQSAHELLLAIKAVARSLPKSVSADSKSQLLRAADSIVSNIVEGCGAATRKEFARYLDISIKSATEVDYASNSRKTRETCVTRSGSRFPSR